MATQPTSRKPHSAPPSYPQAATKKPAGFRGWLNKRLPVDEFVSTQLLEYYAPKNFNIWYFFGSLAGLVLVMQLVTGIFLTMSTSPARPHPSPRSSTSCGRYAGAG
jgi:quinol-cytochrome oxidoreductase complex cytochrome b subunit